jgi:hypothetical protein
METFFRYLVCVLVLWFGPFCFVCRGEAVTIRVINSDGGRPLQKQQVSVSLLYDKGEKTPAKYDANLNLETDVNGEVHFVLPEPAPAHLAVRILIDWGHWDCGGACGVLAASQDVIDRGIVESAADRKKPAASRKAIPGEILFVARPLSLLERLLYPLLKG